MNFNKTSLSEVILISPKVFKDGRGFFLESFKEELFQDNGINERFVQDNHSHSSKGVLRGLHYQITPKAQAKLVRVVSGEIFDVAVDLRPESPTFGKWVGEFLSSENHHMLYIPKGFAHGFLVTKDNTHVLYKASDYYSPEHERGVLWNDENLSIEWPSLDVEFSLSDKDRDFPSFLDLKNKAS